MKTTDFARYLSGFLGSYLPGVRNLSSNTIKSYRDTFRLLLLYCRDEIRMQPEKITLETLTDRVVLEFLSWLQKSRQCGIATRNQRLAAVHAFFRYVQLEEPVLLVSCQRILGIPFKHGEKRAIEHLTPEALQLILIQPDVRCSEGRRDLTILSLLYDSGARVQELADLRVADVRLEEPPVVRLTGKGNKSRYVPLMRNTVALLERYLNEYRADRDVSPSTPLFVNRRGFALTRAGIAYILNKYTKAARRKSAVVPTSVTPHVLRHTKAMHLYQSGVPLVYIRDLLGHVNIETTDVYARADTEMKRQALEKAYPQITTAELADWNENEGLLEWLNNL
jgi:site-specific recombinase XerD